MSLAAASLTRRRAQEKIVKERQDFIKDECNATYVAQWEKKTSLRIEKQDQKNRADRLAEIDKKSLKQRQANICELYAKDEAEWKHKLETSQNISTEDRMLEIREKADRLKVKREKERQDFENQCYERQWRDGCDELRRLHSKAITDKVMRDRSYAFELNDKNKDKVEDASRCRNEQSIKTKENRNNDNDKPEIINKNLEIKAALDAQIECTRQRNQKQNEEQRLEEQKKLETWKKIDEAERRKELKTRQVARLRGEETLKENAKHIQDREREKAIQREQDLVLLKYVLSKEKQDIQKEEQEKYQGKESAREYLRFLKDQSVKEKEENGVVDTIRNEEMDKILTTRENKTHSKDKSKKQLLKEIHASRLQQIAENERREREEKEELARQVSRNQLEWERQEEAERKKAFQKKEETVKNMLANQAVMEEKSRLKTQEKQRELLEQKEIQMDEIDHLDRIKREAGNVVTSFPRRRSQMFD